MRFNLVPVVLTTAAITAFAQEGDERPRRSLGARRLDHDNVNGGAHIEARALSAKAKAAAKKKAAAAAAKASASKKSASLKSKSLASLKSKSLASIASKSKSLASASAKAAASSKSAASAGVSASVAAASIASAKASLAAAQASFSSLASVQEAAIASASGAEKSAALAASSSIAAAQAALSAKQTSVSGAALSVSSAASSVSVASVSIQSQISSLSVASTSFTAAVGSITASIASATSSLAAQATQSGVSTSCAGNNLLWKANCVPTCPGGYSAYYPNLADTGASDQYRHGTCYFGANAADVSYGVSGIEGIEACNNGYTLSASGCIPTASCTTLVSDVSGVSNYTGYDNYEGTYCCADSQAASCDGPYMENSVTCTSPSVLTLNAPIIALTRKRTNGNTIFQDGTCAPSCPSGQIYYSKNAFVYTSATAVTGHAAFSGAMPVCKDSQYCATTFANGACGPQYATAWTTAGVATACGVDPITKAQSYLVAGVCTIKPNQDCASGLGSILSGTTSGVCCQDPLAKTCSGTAATGATLTCKSGNIFVPTTAGGSVGTCQSSATHCAAGLSLSLDGSTCVATSACPGAASTVNNGVTPVTDPNYQSWSVCCPTGAATCNANQLALTCKANYGLTSTGTCQTAVAGCNIRNGLCCETNALSCSSPDDGSIIGTATSCDASSSSTGSQYFLNALGTVSSTPVGHCVLQSACATPASGPTQHIGTKLADGTGVCCADPYARSCRSTATGAALTCASNYPLTLAHATSISGTCSNAIYCPYPAQALTKDNTCVPTADLDAAGISYTKQVRVQPVAADSTTTPPTQAVTEVDEYTECAAGALSCSSPIKATTCDASKNLVLGPLYTCVAKSTCANTVSGASGSVGGICCYDSLAATCSTPVAGGSLTCTNPTVNFFTPYSAAAPSTGTCATTCGTSVGDSVQYYSIANSQTCVIKASCPAGVGSQLNGQGFCCQDTGSASCASGAANAALTCKATYYYVPASATATQGNCQTSCGLTADGLTQYYLDSALTTPACKASCSVAGAAKSTYQGAGFCCADINATVCDGPLAANSLYPCKSGHVFTENSVSINSGAGYTTHDGTCAAAVSP